MLIGYLTPPTLNRMSDGHLSPPNRKNSLQNNSHSTYLKNRKSNGNFTQPNLKIRRLNDFYFTNLEIECSLVIWLHPPQKQNTHWVFDYTHLKNRTLNDHFVSKELIKYQLTHVKYRHLTPTQKTKYLMVMWLRHLTPPTSKTESPVII